MADEMQEQRSVNFDRAADFYDHTRGFPPGVEREVAAAFVQAGKLSRGSRVLEIGIGTGRIAIPLAEQVGAVFGIDISPGMIGRLIAKRGDQAVYPILGDATRLPLPDASFDAVVAVHIFHLLPWQAALAEIVRVLKPGGVLMHGWGASVTIQALVDAWNVAITSPYRMSINQRMGGENFLEDAGWQPTQPSVFHPYTDMRSPRMYLDSLRNRTWSQTWTMSDAEVERAIAAVEAQAAALYPDLDAEQPITQNFRIEVFAPPAPPASAPAP